MGDPKLCYDNRLDQQRDMVIIFTTLNNMVFIARVVWQSRRQDIYQFDKP